MMNESQYIQVCTTVAKKSDVEMIAKMLLDKKLSACAQIIGPVASMYRWKGKMAKSKEWICAAKTKMSLFEKAEGAIKEIHPYELPEIIALPIVKGSREYLNWIEKET